MMFDLTAGTTLVLVTHDEAIAARCRRILRIHSGGSSEGPAAASPTTLCRHLYPLNGKGNSSAQLWAFLVSVHGRC
jgi:hypothetical protein